MTQWHQACRIAVELNLLAIQILVARLVYRQWGKRMSQYQTDFFKIFFYKTVFEIMGFTLVCYCCFLSSGSGPYLCTYSTNPMTEILIGFSLVVISRAARAWLGEAGW